MRRHIQTISKMYGHVQRVRSYSKVKTVLYRELATETSRWVYLQRVWSISLRLYVGWTRQLTHSNKHIRFEYFESRVSPPTFINRHIFLTKFFSRLWFSFYCQYCRQHTTFARSLHSFIIFDTCSDCVDRYCAQRKSDSSATTVTILSI